jgi:pyruvate-formate lyase-activating enzyme
MTGGPGCFTACRGCYNHFARDTAATEQLLVFAQRLRDDLNVQKLTVGGADPLTRPDVVDLLTGLRVLGLTVHLDTVGTAFLRDEKIRFMAKGDVARVDAEVVASLVDLIGIPLDGCSDATVNLFRMHTRLADQLAVLETLDRTAASVCVNTVVHAGNSAELSEIAAVISRYRRVHRWQLFQPAVELASGLTESIRPDTIVTFPRNGVNGHPDHVAAHDIACAVADRYSDTRLLLIADCGEFVEHTEPEYLSAATIRQRRCRATIEVDVRDVLDRKLRAMGEYETQARSIAKFLRLHPDRVTTERYHKPP